MRDFYAMRKEKYSFMRRKLRPRRRKNRALIIVLILAVSSGALIWNHKDKIAVLREQYRAESEEGEIEIGRAHV